jgi:PhzF family phenazine biosynthesis protein
VDREESEVTICELLRYSAFTETPEGGNPAGVVLDARGLSDARMLMLAAEVGYSETAFLSPRPGGEGGVREYDARYFSPEAEVPFCGHATIASAVALAERDGTGDLVFHSGAGPVPVRTSGDSAGGITAALTSVVPRVDDLAPGDLQSALGLLGWSPEDLDPALPPKFAYAGARHLILGARTRARLAELEYDFQGLKAFMLDRDLTTVHLVWRERGDTYHARNPFPVGGVVEDPATGAAAAAFGAYVRELGLVALPATINIHQGDDMGRPSRLTVDIRADRPEISVTGRAVRIPDQGAPHEQLQRPAPGRGARAAG